MNADVSPVELAREPDFRLGGLEVRPSRRELVQGELRSLLEPRVMQVLVALARHRGEVISRDELITACWGGRIVGDDAINACVAKVRRAGEAADAYEIETIPRVGYRLLADPARGAPEAGRTAAAIPDEIVLAVLAFENLSGEPDLGYFAEGVSDEILHALVQQRGLRVIGRSSSFGFRAPNKAARHVGRELGATHVLDGVVRRAGDRVRVSAQLVECATQTMLWSGRSERRLSDIFALEDEIAGAVCVALRQAFAPSGRRAIDPWAYDLYLRGSLRPDHLTEEVHRQRIELVREAVRLAPDFADAWAHLAIVGRNLQDLLTGEEREAARRAADEACDRALAVDSRCARAAVAKGAALPIYGAFREREAWFEKALQWSPGDGEVVRNIGFQRISVGRLREALTLLRRGRELDPLNLGSVSNLGSILHIDGHVVEARDLYADALARWPNFELFSNGLALTLVDLGDFDGAWRVLETHDLGGFHGSVRWAIKARSDASGRYGYERLAAFVERTGHLPLDAFSVVAAGPQRDAAFYLAERAKLGPPPETVNRRGGSISGLVGLFARVNRDLHCDPRFVGVCARIGLVDYWLATERWPDCSDEVAPYYDFKAECRRVPGGADAHG